MIELVTKSGKKHSLDNVRQVVGEMMDFAVIQFHDSTPEDWD